MKIELKIDGVKKKVKNYTYSSNDIHVDFETKRKLPKTFEEFQKITGNYFHSMSKCNSRGNSYTYNMLQIDHTGRLDSKYTALYKLELLRDYFNDGWYPDWNDDKNGKDCIVKKGNNYIKTISFDWDKFLTFKTEKLRNKFLKNFKELIEDAEDLI